jgi:hypothetical protein
MTLCVAWRDDNGVVYLASDSRVTIQTHSRDDVAIKITRIPCEIFPPTQAGTFVQPAYRFDLGMAFAGSHMGAYVIKETLSELLMHLQYVHGQTNVSMEKIAKIAFHVYSELSKSLCNTALAHNGICEIFLTGFCYAQNINRVYKFSTNPITNTHSFKEVLLNGVIELSGSPSAKKCAVASPNYPSNPLAMLQDVINDVSVVSVGGAVQFGTYDQRRFDISGHYRLSAQGQPEYMRGGLDVNALINCASADDFTPAVRMIQI